ncbi:hypothetical protein QW131_07805 [Roseibium salinum]|nr:hypothetical protein [Roseibium salinum]
MIAEALTGKQIDMGGTQAQIVDKRRHVPSLEGMDIRFRPLLEAMLQPDPANRPATMAEIAEWTLGAPMMRQMPDKTIIRPSGPSPEQSALDEPQQPARWGRRILVALSLLGFAGAGAGGVYFLVGQNVPEVVQRPVLVAPPRDNAPDVPIKPTNLQPDDTKPETGTGANTVPEIPTQPVDESNGGQPPVADDPVIEDGPPEVIPAREEPPEEVAPEDRIRNFVSSYQAGDCMYLQPVRIASRIAEIEGFASRTPPFISFDSDFTQSQGFEAKIQVNLVSDEQCPAIAFFCGRRLKAARKPSCTWICSGRSSRTAKAWPVASPDMTPRPADWGSFFVGSKGEVTNLSPYLQTDDGGAGFVIPLNLKTAVEETGLVIAMVGKDITSTLAKRQEKQAEPFFEKPNAGCTGLAGDRHDSQSGAVSNSGNAIAKQA